MSALDYTAVNNCPRIAIFLADLYYMMGEDPACRDISGNTRLHMLARIGDASAPTLQAVLALRYYEPIHDIEVKLCNLHRLAAPNTTTIYS